MTVLLVHPPVPPQRARAQERPAAVRRFRQRADQHQAHAVECLAAAAAREGGGVRARAAGKLLRAVRHGAQNDVATPISLMECLI